MHHPDDNDHQEQLAMTMLDDYLAIFGGPEDLNTCPHCGGAIREHEYTATSQRVTIERDDGGGLTITDWDDYEAHDGTMGTHYSCESYEHIFPTLADLDQEQREQCALRCAVMGDPSHFWNHYGDEPGAFIRLAVIYSRPMFSGRRARMARRERRARRRGYREIIRPRDVYRATFALTERPRHDAADDAARELRSAGIL